MCCVIRHSPRMQMGGTCGRQRRHEDNKRQNKRQISHVDMGDGTGGKDLAVWSTGFWARLRVRVRVSRRSRYQGTHRHRHTHASSCGVDRIALCPTRTCTGP